MAGARIHTVVKCGTLLGTGVLSLGALWRAGVAAQRRCRKLAHSVPPAPPPCRAQPGEEVPAVPRVLPFVVMNRDAPKVRDHYGHWWIEIDGLESYGWWADHCPFRMRDMIAGTRGVVNGVGGTCRGGTPTTDPRHGDEPDFYFFPVLVVPKSDRQVREDIRAFARCYSGAWGWQWWWSRERMTQCHMFQDDLFQAVGLREPAEYLYTRGPGCPFMYPWRQLAWKMQDRLAMIRARLPAQLKRASRRLGTMTPRRVQAGRCQPCERPTASWVNHDRAEGRRATAGPKRDMREVGVG